MAQFQQLPGPTAEKTYYVNLDLVTHVVTNAERDKYTVYFSFAAVDKGLTLTLTQDQLQELLAKIGNNVPS